MVGTGEPAVNKTGKVPTIMELKSQLNSWHAHIHSPACALCCITIELHKATSPGRKDLFTLLHKYRNARARLELGVRLFTVSRL